MLHDANLFQPSFSGICPACYGPVGSCSCVMKGKRMQPEIGPSAVDRWLSNTSRQERTDDKIRQIVAEIVVQELEHCMAAPTYDPNDLYAFIVDRVKGRLSAWRDLLKTK